MNFINRYYPKDFVSFSNKRTPNSDTLSNKKSKQSSELN